MGRLLDENTYVNRVAFDFEEKLNSPYTRMMELNPQPCTYFNISDPDSTVDDGLYSVERTLGSHSPTRYKKIEGLPIYMDDQILLDLNDNEEGLTTSYEADGKILPGTIIPYPDDYFYIHYLGKRFIFRVTEIAYDTIKSYNYYKINFTIKSVDSEDTYKDLERQTVERYNCIIRNIGTDEKWIVEEDEYRAIQTLNQVYDMLNDMYLNIYYNPVYNVLMFHDEERGVSVYDRYMTNFINRNEIFARKYDYETVVLSEIDFDRPFTIDYGQSIYRMIELGRLKKVRNVPYFLGRIKDPLSIFKMYGDESVRSVYLKAGNIGEWYLPTDALIDGPLLDKLNPHTEEDSSKNEIKPENYVPPNPMPGNSQLPPILPTSFTLPEEPPMDQEPKPETLLEEPEPEQPPEESYEVSPVEPEGPIGEDSPEEFPEAHEPSTENNPATPVTEPSPLDYPDISPDDVDSSTSYPSVHDDPLMEDVSPDDLDIPSEEPPVDPIELLPVEERIIKKYFLGQISHIKHLPLVELSEIDFLKYDWNTFVTTPILLYALRNIYQEFMKVSDK